MAKDFCFKLEPNDIVVLRNGESGIVYKVLGFITSELLQEITMSNYNYDLTYQYFKNRDIMEIRRPKYLCDLTNFAKAPIIWKRKEKSFYKMETLEELKIYITDILTL